MAQQSILATDNLNEGRLKIQSNFTELYLMSGSFVTPEMFGAVGDGTTNDQAALQAAVNTGKSVICDGSKNYRVNTSVQIPDNTVFEGNGCIISTTSNIHVFYIYTMGQNCYINNVNFLGNNTGAGQLGINLSTYRARVTNCTFRNFFYAGMYVVTTAGAADYEGGVQIANCYFENNTGRGLYLYTNAEYNNVVNCTSRGNGYGVSIRGGNNNWVGGKITDNTVGVELQSGSNDGHGLVACALINHNGTQVSASGITNNFLFANNMFYAGVITLTSNTGIRFDGNEFGGTGGVITCTNNTLTEFSNNKFVLDYTINITGTAPRWFNNTFNTGTIPANLVQNVLSATATLDFPDTAAGSVSDLTLSVTGAAVGDPVYVGAPNGSIPDKGSFFGWVSSANTVTVRYVNNDLTTSKDPASGTFKVVVFKYL